jgi:hypothetical protein
LESHRENPCNFGVKGTPVASSIQLQKLLDPSNNLVACGSRGLVDDQHTILDVLHDGTVQRRGPVVRVGLLLRLDQSSPLYLPSRLLIHSSHLSIPAVSIKRIPENPNTTIKTRIPVYY